MLSPDQARDLAESLVQRATDAGADAADAVYNGSRSSSVTVRLGELEDVDRSEGEEAGLRLFLGQRSASVSTSDFSGEALDALVARALAMAAEAPDDPYAGIAPKELVGRGPFADLDSADSHEPGPEALRERALQAESAARSVAGIANSDGASAGASAGTMAFAASNGFSGVQSGTGHSCSATVIAGEGSAMQRDHHWHSVRHLEDLDDPAEIGRIAGERAVSRLGSSHPRPGRYPVLFDPRVATSLLGHFAGGISGSAIARKASFLLDCLGERIFAAGVSIIDDPLRPRGLRSRPFDGEGLPVAKAEMVADGVLNRWMADCASARQIGIDPTGHAVRGSSGAPGVAPSNLYFAPGPDSRQDLFAQYDEAVLVTELIGHGVNGVTGDYSRGAAGFMVRGGEIAEPVSEMTIASNLKDMFATLIVGNDLEFRRGIDSPTLLIPEMTVAAG